MSHFTGSRQELRKAVVLVATAQGRTATMEALDDLSEAAQAWKHVLSVSPQKDALGENRIARALKRAA